MPAPDVGRWLDTLYVVGAGIAALIIGAWAVIKKFGRRNNRDARTDYVKLVDLERLHRQIQEEAKDERHDDIYPEIHKISIENERDIARVDQRIDLVAEGSAVEIKRVEQIIAEFARSIDLRLGDIQSSVAVLKDRTARQDRLEERLERVEGRRR